MKTPSISADQIFVILRENSSLADKVLAMLPEKEATVIRNIYIDLMPYQEIADELGMTIAHVRTIRKSAINKLKHPNRVNIIKDYLPTQGA